MSMPTASPQSIFGQNVWKVLYLVVFVFVSHCQNSVNGRDRGFHTFTVIGWPHHTYHTILKFVFFSEVFVWKRTSVPSFLELVIAGCVLLFGRNVKSFEPMFNKPSSKGLEALRLVCLQAQVDWMSLAPTIVIVCIRLFDLNWRQISLTSKYLQVWRQKPYNYLLIIEIFKGVKLCQRKVPTSGGLY